MDFAKDTSGINLSRAFVGAGWIGFWAQIVLGAAPVLVATWLMMASSFRGRLGENLDWGVAFASISYIILIFTTFWFLRYVSVGRKMASSPDGMPRSKLAGMVRTGLVASCIGIAISGVVLLVKTANILIAFLNAPQGGLPVIQTAGEGSNWISAIDTVSLMGVALTISAEIVVVVLGFWLFLRISTAKAIAPA